MAVYAISDLHLSAASNKPMDVFGDIWREHDVKIKNNWNSSISKDDYVLLAGDISWGMKLDEALPDIEYIHNLNGKKIIIKGNHDYWWNSVSKINALYDDITFLQNTSYMIGGTAICGTRGWININSEVQEHDKKIYKRELIRLELSLKSAKTKGAKDIIAMMHYPPATKQCKCDEFIELLNSYNVKKLIYGHIHSTSRHICINGLYSGIDFICTSADLINFEPVRIL